MSGKIVIFGYGPVGRATAARLLAEGREVAIAQRRPPPDLAYASTFTPCDALDPDSVLKASRGAGQFVVAIGFPYTGAVWRAAWPRAISNFVGAAEATGARMVFIDNLYMYGPQMAPLVETTPLTDFGAKPAARAAATRIWMEAASTGRARVAALRAPDFYGPGVGQSYLGDATIGALAKGKAAVFIGSPDILHDFDDVPDVARAATTLLDAPDSAFGRAWHVPCAPTRTTRQILEIAAEALGVRLQIHQLPVWLLRPAGLFSPQLREFVEMRFQWDRPYCVVASRFAKAFWSDATPFETGAQLTALAFRAAVEASKRQPHRPKPPSERPKTQREALSPQPQAPTPRPEALMPQSEAPKPQPEAFTPQPEALKGGEELPGRGEPLCAATSLLRAPPSLPRAPMSLPWSAPSLPWVLTSLPWASTNRPSAATSFPWASASHASAATSLLRAPMSLPRSGPSLSRSATSLRGAATSFLKGARTVSESDACKGLTECRKCGRRGGHLCCGGSRNFRAKFRPHSYDGTNEASRHRPGRKLPARVPRATVQPPSQRR